jgi:TM2 domain-containing membrane protein YozV
MASEKPAATAKTEPTEEIFTEANKPIISGVLSLLVPGLGQAYNGHMNKGAVMFVIAIIIWFVLSFVFYFLHIIYLLWALFAAYDAYMEAKGKPVWKFGAPASAT